AWAHTRGEKGPTSNPAKLSEAAICISARRISASTAILVAVVAGRGAVAEASHAVVNIHGRCLLVRGLRVAIDAGEARIVGGYLVAVIAHRAVVRYREVRVVKRRVQPARRHMARVASGGIPRCNVIRHLATQRLRAQPRRLVASIASGVRTAQA